MEKSPAKNNNVEDKNEKRRNNRNIAVSII